MNRNRKRIIAGNEISELHTFKLGGVEQKVLIEGKSRELPIVICLHGGPGTPIPFSVGCRGLFPQFTDRFIMVYWDQLGCGINNCKLEDRFGVDDFVQMTIDLIAEVRSLFANNKLVLFGMSWGSVLALKASLKAVHSVDAVVVWGQVMRKLFMNDFVYEALEKAGFSKKKMKRIRSVTAENFTDRDMQLISGSVRKYTDGYTNKAGKQAPVGPIIKGLITSPDYSFRDFSAIMANGTASSTRLWPELLKIDMSTALSQVEVPYYILQGDTDIVTPTAYAAAAVESANNPNLSLRVVEKSGHQPGEEGMQAVFETLVRAAAGE